MFHFKKEKHAELKSCRKCMVYNKKGQQLSKARVDASREPIRLYFRGYELRNIHYAGRVDFYDTQNGLITTMCDLVFKRNPDYPQQEEPWMAECRIHEVDQVLQRQKDIRVDTSLMVAFRSAERGNFAGRILNLSAGGFYMTTTQRLKNGEEITFSYQFAAAVRPFSATVLRGEPHPTGGYGYGCRFHDLTDRAETVIRGYVFRKLAEQERGKGGENN